ncbi:DUF2306 domain-containing protein [Oceanomicrobium pacificus]|uniref:DUF2306 domain-containing protein n=1 Tax=Oceanomicrobium pacificus TaxID=2692916 RepID=A0A6B0TQU8_9RHOB|nr:hypothetical protein [Oceanomicrobium pacificus]MXU65059.1 hypothetical protein [Oceanomicrobium pacificus]
MTILGLMHLGLMIAALLLGAAILARRKGDGQHKRMGHLFVSMMVLSNLIVFGIHEDTEALGIFHYLAIVSLMSLGAGVLLARYSRGRVSRKITHGHVMLWTYGGMGAAGVGQAATALGYSPWPGIVGTLALVAFAVLRLDFRAMLMPQRTGAK